MKIINLNDYKGRDRELVVERSIYVGRPMRKMGIVGSALHNPYKIGADGDRGEVIEKYRRHLWCKIQQRDPEVMQALKELDEGSVLSCWCYPQPCHAQVIEKAWKYCKDHKII